MATDMIVMRPRRDPREPGETHKHLLGDGLVRVDYGEPGQVFLVQVAQVPRVPLIDAARALGGLDDGIEVWLADVTVDTFAGVTLEGRGDAAQSALQTYKDERAGWEGAVQDLPDAAAPAWPAERLLVVNLTLSDNQATQYQINSGQTGGTGREWMNVWHYLPMPPPEATTRTLPYR
jgi:hypothetical protein